MNETELKDLSDKILSGELVLDEELEKLLERFAEFCKKIAEYLENTFIPAIKDFLIYFGTLRMFIMANAHSMLSNIKCLKIRSPSLFILIKGEKYIYAEAIVDRK